VIWYALCRNIIERFIEARKYAKNKPNDMVDICENLLDEPQLESAIRVGDCLGMLVEHFHQVGDMKRSYQYMVDMKERRILLHPYIDAQVLDDVHRAVGIPLDGEDENDDVVDGGSDNEELEDDIEEEVEEVPPMFFNLSCVQIAHILSLCIFYATES
jgi:intraflagellar transport protein 140